MKGKGDYTDVSKQFKQFRPTYPSDLYDFVLSCVSNKDTAWDCGTGNGQVASILSNYFNNVIATDLCEAQIDNATLADNINYIVTKSENSTISENSVDLITSAQAVHWFDIENFYKEAKRVGRENAIIALWGYNRYRIDAVLDDIMDSFYSKFLDAYWHDTPRVFLANAYRTLPFDFEEIASPKLEIKVDWKLSQIEGYLETMSSVQEYIKENQHDPVPDLMQELMKEWHTDTYREVTFPIFMRVGKIHKP